MKKLGNAVGSCVRNSMIAETKIRNRMSGQLLTFAEISAKHYLMFDREKMNSLIVFFE